MDAAAQHEGHPHVALQPLVTVSAAYEGSATDIAAGHLARGFLARGQADHGLPIRPQDLDSCEARRSRQNRLRRSGQCRRGWWRTRESASWRRATYRAVSTCRVPVSTHSVYVTSSSSRAVCGSLSAAERRLSLSHRNQLPQKRRHGERLLRAPLHLYGSSRRHLRHPGGLVRHERAPSLRILCRGPVRVDLRPRQGRTSSSRSEPLPQAAPSASFQAAAPWIAAPASSTRARGNMDGNGEVMGSGGPGQGDFRNASRP